jgi:hypothetical protein
MKAKHVLTPFWPLLFVLLTSASSQAFAQGVRDLKSNFYGLVIKQAIQTNSANIQKIASGLDALVKNEGGKCEKFEGYTLPNALVTFQEFQKDAKQKGLTYRLISRQADQSGQVAFFVLTSKKKPRIFGVWTVLFPSASGTLVLCSSR